MRRFAYSVKEAAEGLGVGKSTLYREIEKGNIPSVRVGRRRVIPHHAMQEWMDEWGGEFETDEEFQLRRELEAERQREDHRDCGGDSDEY